MTLYGNKLRHEADQGDKLDKYGWLRHDGKTYGHQEIIDGDYNITVEMVSRRDMR